MFRGRLGYLGCRVQVFRGPFGYLHFFRGLGSSLIKPKWSHGPIWVPLRV